MLTTPSNNAHSAMMSANAATDAIGREMMKTPTIIERTPRNTNAHLVW